MILILSLTACAGNRRVKPGQHVVTMPPECASIDKFYEPCRPAKDGVGYDCHVHMKVKPQRECNQYNTQDILQVNP